MAALRREAAGALLGTTSKMHLVTYKNIAARFSPSMQHSSEAAPDDRTVVEHIFRRDLLWVGQLNEAVSSSDYWEMLQRTNIAVSPSEKLVLFSAAMFPLQTSALWHRLVPLNPSTQADWTCFGPQVRLHRATTRPTGLAASLRLKGDLLGARISHRRRFGIKLLACGGVAH